jgi:Collagen triple helix repeat (20 copies)
MLVALLALFVALGGSSYAAITLSTNSVKSKHIAKGAVKRADIGSSTVDSGKVADGSLLRVDFATGELPPAGPKGDKGDTGASGATGATGAQGDPGPQGIPGQAGDRGPQGDPGMSGYQRVVAFDGFGESLTTESRDVNCPAGKKVVGGGAEFVDADRNVAISGSRAIDDDTWRVTATEVVETADSRWLDAYAICVNVAP